MICPRCDGELSDGITQCFHCGQDLQSDEFILRVRGIDLDAEPPNAEYWALQNKRQAGTRRFYEGRALERAGDVAAATTIYEELVRDGYDFYFPYKRLAIIYRRAHRYDDEERIVRAALAADGDSPAQPWFSSRLAKFVARRAVETLSAPPDGTRKGEIGRIVLLVQQSIDDLLRTCRLIRRKHPGAEEAAKRVVRSVRDMESLKRKLEEFAAGVA